MAWLDCPYLHAEVELTDERERHIARQHPDLLPAYRQSIIDTLKDPDGVRRSARVGNARLFSRWFDNIRGGKHVVVVVVSGAGDSGNHWIIMAYLSTGLASGEIEWTRS
jgi:hypothetical protein